MNAVPTLPFADTAAPALVLGEASVGADVPVDPSAGALVEQQRADGADLVVVPAALAATLAEPARLVVDLGDGNGQPEGGPATGGVPAVAVAGRVDRWSAALVTAVAASDATVLVGCSDAGADHDPALPRLRAGLERSIERLVAAGVAEARLVLDTTATRSVSVDALRALIAGHGLLVDLGQPVVASIPPPEALSALASVTTPTGVDDPDDAVVAVASVLAAAGCRGIRSVWPRTVRRVVTIGAAIEQARRR